MPVANVRRDGTGNPDPIVVTHEISDEPYGAIVITRVGEEPDPPARSPRRMSRGPGPDSTFTNQRRGRDSFEPVFRSPGFSAIPDAMSMPVNDL